MSTATTPKPASKNAWVKAAVHTVTLSSGTVVDIKLPNLPELASSGDFPNHLVDAAIAAAQAAEAPTRDDIAKQAEFYRILISKTVIEPKIEPDDVPTLPFEDVELIVALATRNRDVDALGHHIAGLDENEDWRRFRGLTDGD